MFYAFLPTRGGPRIFSSVSASTLILCERRGRGTSEHRACAGQPTIEIQCVFQRKQILPFTRAFCMIMVHAHLAAFRKWFWAPMETSLDVSPRSGGAKKDVNSRQPIQAGHQLTGFCRTCDNVTESGHSSRMMELLNADWRSSKSATRT